MQWSSSVFQICKDKDRLGLFMNKRKEPMGHMVGGLNLDTNLIVMIQSEMVGSWTHLTRGVMIMGSILVLVKRNNIIITITIHIGGVRRNNCHRSSRKKMPPTFDGEMKKTQDANAWFLGMNKLFWLHGYSENMEAMIATFSLKEKTYIWWEYVKNFIGIWEEELTWSEFERLFRKNYLSERYYDDMTQELYELKMGSMTNEEYTSIFLDLLRYLPYIKEEKEIF